MGKLYVLLCYFWEGDSYLVSDFKGVFDSIESVPEEVTNHKVEYKDRMNNKVELKYKGFYLPGEELPEESDGHYGCPVFFALQEIEVNKLFAEI